MKRRQGPMTIEQALNTALEFEGRVHEVYAEALAAETDPTARRTLEVLAQEETYHLEYLQRRRDEWLSEGRIHPEAVRTAIPPRAGIARGVAVLKKRLSGGSRTPHRHHVELLQRAQRVEEETSRFYRQLVGEIEGDAREMFARFLEIEDGHLALVSAELDAVQGLGFWFDVREFDLEAG